MQITFRVGEISSKSWALVWEPSYSQRSPLNTYPQNVVSHWETVPSKLIVEKSSRMGKRHQHNFSFSLWLLWPHLTPQAKFTGALTQLQENITQQIETYRTEQLGDCSLKKSNGSFLRIVSFLKYFIFLSLQTAFQENIDFIIKVLDGCLSLDKISNVEDLYLLSILVQTLYMMRIPF